MKKILMTLAAVLCCAMTMTVLTACSNDNDDNPVTPPSRRKNWLSTPSCTMDTAAVTESITTCQR